MSERLCVTCIHWRFDGGSPGYSEYTPGTEWNSSCVKGKWETDGYKDEGEYRKCLLTARDCEQFEHYKEGK